MPLRFPLLLASLAALLTACGGDAKTPTQPIDTTSTTGYKNPVLNRDFPDPSVIKVGATYWAYATQTFLGNGAQLNIQSASSTDLINWTYGNDVLPVRPTWSTQVWNFWAPHVIAVPSKGNFLMYFAADADTSVMCIGMATSTTPAGPFTDVGSPLVCGKDYWHIDPMEFDDPATGRHYLYWGSNFKPIAVQELDSTLMHFVAGSQPTMVIDTSRTNPYEQLVEGPWVIKRGAYYYLFYSGNNCCTPGSLHYAVMVARSTSPTGPFQKLGAALGTGNSTILTGDDKWIAPGHNAIVTDSNGDDWIVYHAVDPQNPTLSDNASIRRPMLIDRIKYDANGWPYVEGGHPSHGNATPPTITP
ncbi:MAG: glycoside hydrolase family 43 protein [Gemmatimonadaceae bacterium]